MGYYTSFSLEAELVVGTKVAELADNTPLVEAVKQFRAENENARMAFDDEGNTQEQCKWYEYGDELADFSKKFPNILFTLNGEGEETGDIWALYVLNGKRQVAKAKVEVAPVNLTELVK